MKKKLAQKVNEIRGFPVLCKKSKFRVSAKRIFLTYSQVGSELTAKQVLLQLQGNLGGLEEYLVAKEYHKESGVHFHTVLSSKKKFNIEDPRKLDISFGKQTFHGNYKPVRNYKKAVEYACKEGDYISNIQELKDGKLLSLEESLKEMVHQKGAKETLKFYIERQGKKAFGSKSAVSAKRYFELIESFNQDSDDEAQSPLKIDDFSMTEEIKEWIHNNCQPTGILVGPAGCGKTLFVETLAKEKGWKTHVVQHPDGLKDLKKEHDMISFDDVNFEGSGQQLLLAIMETSRKRNLRVIYGVIKKKAGLVQVISLNEDAFNKISHKLEARQYLRRFTLMPVQANFITNITNNIVINNHTNIYNNDRACERNFKHIMEIRKKKEVEKHLKKED